LGGKVLAEGRPIRTANYREDPDIPPDFREVALAERFVAEIAVPIRIEKAVAGVLFVIRRTARAFSAADETILIRLADQAAIAIANARLFQDQLGEAAGAWPDGGGHRARPEQHAGDHPRPGRATAAAR